ncbi:MAG: glycosyltransferase family 2 protein [Desulfobulbaceae bacterium]|nr:glycosyltransferase family 2 protein [Desulfobulbaceae bacterium]
MSQKKITAIVVLYHSKHLLGGLLRNMTEKISELDEVILIDNSHQDLSEFESRLVKVIHPAENIGYGAAINLGIKKAKNDKLAILNPDVTIARWALPEKIEQSEFFILSSKPHEWPCMRRFPGIIFDFFRFALGNLGGPFKWVQSLYGVIKIIPGKTLQAVDWVSGSLIVTNKSTMNKLNGFDEKFFLFYEEVDLCKRASLLGIPCCITPMITFFTNQGTASSTNVNEIKFVSSIKSAQRFHSKHTGKNITRLIFKLLKIYCWLISILLKTFNSISNYPKALAKERQYQIYYQNIK